MFAAPIDWIFQYVRRPKSVITKSEYIDRARGLAQRAKEIKVSCGQADMKSAIEGSALHAVGYEICVLLN